MKEAKATANNDIVVKHQFYAVTNITEAATAGDVMALQRLLDNGKYDQRLLNNALKTASNAGHHEVVKLLLERGADVHIGEEDALRMAAYYGYFDIVKLLLTYGAKSEARDYYAPYFAARNGHYRVVKLLLEKGVDVRAFGCTAFYDAAERGHYEVVKLLLEYVVDIRVRVDIALRYAAEKGHYDVAILLLSYGAQINFKIADLKDETTKTLLKLSQAYPVTEKLITEFLINCLKEIPLKGQPLGSDIAAIIGSYLPLNAKCQIMEPVLKTVLKLNQRIHEIESSWFNKNSQKKPGLIYCRNLFLAKPHVSGAKIVEMVEQRYPDMHSGFFSNRSGQLLKAIAAGSVTQKKEETTETPTSLPRL